ncbi:uncharacterized protein LOC109203926 isoform X1 [Oreochromis niloticus]|uniref:uncharacterized protein LOC109203926 isoform X1 n=1 Tax=Oreochromis niloticus TaxID=8128 RepID=UPI000DF1D6E6|nr:uncharacterized protein LOC109203926 isoform X1 [Oreochromis niloticus]
MLKKKKKLVLLFLNTKNNPTLIKMQSKAYLIEILFVTTLRPPARCAPSLPVSWFLLDVTTSKNQHKMSKRPKLSGAQGRKKRKEEEEKREKDRDALLKFLNPTPGPSTTSTAAASTSAAQPTSDAASAAQPSHDAAASSGLPVASTSAAQPTSFAAASSGVPVASTSAAQPSSDAAASSGPPAAPIDPADWPSALTEKLDVAVDLLKKTKDSLTSYRNTGFSDAQTTAKEMCEEMNVEAELKQKRLRTTKRHFGYESPDEPIQDALKKMETTFFNVVVDTAISSLDERFQNLGEVNDKFGVLLNFHNLQKEELLQQCQTLSTTLTHDSQPDINGTELAMEMQNFPPLPSKNMTNMELLTFLHEKKLAEIYPNMWVALRIFATLPVTVAAAERSFSKLKLIKTYLRSTMMQERLSGLSIISINHVVSNQLSYDDVVDDFAARKTRRVRL